MKRYKKYMFEADESNQQVQKKKRRKIGSVQNDWRNTQFGDLISSASNGGESGPKKCINLMRRLVDEMQDAIQNNGIVQDFQTKKIEINHLKEEYNTPEVLSFFYNRYKPTLKDYTAMRMEKKGLKPIPKPEQMDRSINRHQISDIADRVQTSNDENRPRFHMNLDGYTAGSSEAVQYINQIYQELDNPNLSANEYQKLMNRLKFQVENFYIYKKMAGNCLDDANPAQKRIIMRAFDAVEKAERDLADNGIQVTKEDIKRVANMVMESIVKKKGYVIKESKITKYILNTAKKLVRLGLVK